jgi:hypothetical protein
MAPAIPYPPKSLSSRYINTNMIASPFDRAVDPSAIWPLLQNSESSAAHAPASSHLHISFLSDSIHQTCKTIVSPDGRSEWERPENPTSALDLHVPGATWPRATPASTHAPQAQCQRQGPTQYSNVCQRNIKATKTACRRLLTRHATVVQRAFTKKQ